MAVALTVSQIRQELYRAAGQTSAGDGSPSTAAIGTIFHRVIGELLRSDSTANIETVLRNQEPDLAAWKAILLRHSYDQFLGPLLTQQMGSLNHHGDMVLNLWRAVREACDWLADVWWNITDQGIRVVNQSDYFWAERQVVCEVHRPGWREPVAVLGQADAVLRVPTTNRWCLLEWKLGQTSPAVDLGQACLYHLMLNGEGGSRSDSALAVISFRPQIQETLFERAQLDGVQGTLIDLIGRLAGVAGEKPTSPKAIHDIRPPKPIEKEPTAKTPVIKPTSEWVTTTGESLLRVLRLSGAPCREAKTPVIGPAYARFFVFPERGITAKKVTSQGEQLQLHLGLDSPPNMTLVEGTIGVDLPRTDRQSIPFSDFVRCLPTIDEQTGCSKLPIGVDLNGRWHWCDLAGPESAHMLVVGTPGSGKSQWLRTAVASLMRTNTAETLELLLIDPKQNAFTFANRSRFLMRPIIVPDGKLEVSEILVQIVSEMEKRYRQFAGSNSQSLVDHVRTTGSTMKRIVCVCDEYADLLAACDKVERAAIEHQFTRLAAKGRASGIHLILATQQPKANILTTSIRSLLSAKVALRVSDARESRLALEQDGAERLLGNGDLLYKCIGSAIRLQGAWLPSAEEHLVSPPIQYDEAFRESSAVDHAPASMPDSSHFNGGIHDPAISPHSDST